MIPHPRFHITPSHQYAGSPALKSCITVWQLAITVLVAVSFHAGAQVQAPSVVIDDCAYPDESAARNAWVPMRGSLPVSLIQTGARKALRFPCNFKESAIERASWDRKVHLDLSSASGVQFEVLCPDASPVSYFSIYFQSGGGWYHASFFPESDTSWNTIKIDKASTVSEGTPAGWGRISTIRISAWRARASDTEFTFRNLRQTGVLGEDATVAIVRAESASGRAAGGARESGQYAERMAKELQELNLGFAVVSDLDLTASRLRSAKVAILPYNPGMPERAVDELALYVKGGGKLLAFYSIPEKLRSLLGAQGGEHVKAEKPGGFSTIRMVGGLRGSPSIITQQSWNISALKPVPGISKTLAGWHNVEGKPTGHAAIIGSSTGMIMTHVLLPDDPVNKQRMLLAMLGSLSPSLWKQAVDGRMASIGRIGQYENFDQAVQGLLTSAGKSAQVQEGVASARASRDQAKSLALAGDHARAIEAADLASRQLLEAFCRSQKPLPGEFRAFWCHSAFGVSGMSWDEAVKRLADSGFTAILPNMLWGGAAFYDSEILPTAAEADRRGDQIKECLAACRKYGIQVHVWKVNWNLGHAAPRELVERMRREGRLQSDATGKEESWLCPSHPKNQEMEIASMVEVAKNYAVDGIHFDYIRYPGNDHCFCSGCKDRFQKSKGVRLSAWPGDVRGTGPLRQEWLGWRRENITQVVRAVSTQARVVRPTIKISAAVFPNWDRDRDNIGQDWKAWCDQGYLDFVCPMDYTPSNRSFNNMVSQQVQWAGRVPCYPGIGVSASSSRFGPDGVVDQILISRKLNTGGFTIFNYGVPESRELLPLLGMGITAKSR